MFRAFAALVCIYASLTVKRDDCNEFGNSQVCTYEIEFQIGIGVEEWMTFEGVSKNSEASLFI